MMPAVSAPRWFGPAVLIAAFGVAVAFLLRLFHLPLRELVTYTADDAYHYLQIARNLAQHGQLSFDGEHTASGFHPLWLAVLTLPAALTTDRVTLVYSAQAIGMAAHLATAVVVVFVVREFRTGLWPYLVAALWAVQPFGLARATDGMEAAVSLLAISLGALWCVRLAGRPAGSYPVARAGLVTGLLLALIYLARTDGISFGAVGIALLAWHARARIADAARATAISAGLLGAAIAGFAIVLWRVTGYPTQASGEIKLLWGLQRWPGLQNRLVWAIHVFSNLWFGDLFRQFFGVPHGISLMLVAVAIATVGIVGARRALVGDRRLAALAIWLLGSTAFNGLLYALLFHDLLIWYGDQSAFALFLVSAIAFGLVPIPSRLVERAATLLAIACIVWGAALSIRESGGQSGGYPSMAPMFDVTQAIDALVPEGQSVGSFDAGQHGFFAHRRVVNLDGLVNDSTRPYWRAHRIDAYIAASDLEYFADDPSASLYAKGFGVHWPALTPLYLLSRSRAVRRQVPVSGGAAPGGGGAARRARNGRGASTPASVTAAAGPTWPAARPSARCRPRGSAGVDSRRRCAGGRRGSRSESRWSARRAGARRRRAAGCRPCWAA